MNLGNKIFSNISIIDSNTMLSNVASFYAKPSHEVVIKSGKKDLLLNLIDDTIFSISPNISVGCGSIPELTTTTTTTTPSTTAPPIGPCGHEISAIGTFLSYDAINIKSFLTSFFYIKLSSSLSNDPITYYFGVRFIDTSSGAEINYFDPKRPPIRPNNGYFYYLYSTYILNPSIGISDYRDKITIPFNNSFNNIFDFFNKEITYEIALIDSTLCVSTDTSTAFPVL